MCCASCVLFQLLGKSGPCYFCMFFTPLEINIILSALSGYFNSWTSTVFIIFSNIFFQDETVEILSILFVVHNKSGKKLCERLKYSTWINSRMW
jgi:hypothetical protein